MDATEQKSFLAQISRKAWSSITFTPTLLHVNGCATKICWLTYEGDAKWINDDEENWTNLRTKNVWWRWKCKLFFCLRRDAADSRELFWTTEIGRRKSFCRKTVKNWFLGIKVVYSWARFHVNQMNNNITLFLSEDSFSPIFTSSFC